MSETVRVYHGSKRGLELWPDRRSLREAKSLEACAIRADRGNPAADFGAGFYMGMDAHQPQTLICGGASPVLYTLDFDPSGLKAYEFQPGLDWALFVAFRREGQYFDEILDRMAKEGAECP